MLLLLLLLLLRVCAGKPTRVLMTNMDQPLGRTVGNWFEMKEAIEICRGQGGEGLSDVVDLSVAFAAEMLILSKEQQGGGTVPSHEEACDIARANLHNGAAYASMCAMLEAQGADLSIMDDLGAYPTAARSRAVVHDGPDGFVSSIDALEIGLTAVGLGAGRADVLDKIDYGAGITFEKKVGDAVATGDVLLTVHTDRAEDVLDAGADRAAKAMMMSETRPEQADLISYYMDKNGVKSFKEYLEASA